MGHEPKDKDPAFLVMTMDILSNVLGRADNPADLGTYLTEEIRNLTGAHCVLLVQCLSVASMAMHRVVGVDPPRRREWAESSAANRLFGVIERMTVAQFWRGDEPSEAAGLLRREGFELSMVFPLAAGPFRVGAMLVLGLPDEEHISSVLGLLNNLSAIVALVLRTSFLFERQEQLIKASTEELQKANEQLKVDLAERKHAEEVIRSSEEKFAKAFRSSPNLMAITTLKEGRIIEINDAYCRVIGYNREECTGRTTSELRIWADPEQRKKTVQRIREEGHARNVEVDLRHKSGGIRSVVLSMDPLIINNQEYLLSVAVDITERRKAEDTIRSLNANLSATLQAIPDLLFELSRDGRYLNIWAQNPDLLARQKEILLGHTVSQMLTPDAAETVMEAIREADDKGSSYGKVIRLDVPEGTKWFELSTARKASTDALDGQFIMLSRDITERKRAEDEKLRSEQRLRLHAERSPLGFLEWDENFRAVEWNAACERIFGYTREEALGRHAKELILPVEVHELVDGIYQSLMSQTGGQHSINENITKDGRIITCEWFNTTLINKEGKAIGVASVCNDITEQKRMEAELAGYREHLEEQVKERTSELEEKNKELQKMNRLFVGRELRMTELKEKIAILEEETKSLKK